MTTQLVNKEVADFVLLRSAALWLEQCQVLLDDQLLTQITACFPKCNNVIPLFHVSSVLMVFMCQPNLVGAVTNDYVILQS